MSLFSYQGSWFAVISAATSLLYHALFCLSRTFFNFFSKVFLMFFFSNLLSEYWFYHWFSLLSRTFFIFLNFLFYSNDSKKYGEGGIWTLAPRERSTPLAGAPLQPLEYFSKFKCIQFWTAFISDAFEIILYEFTFVNAFFNFFQLFILYHRNALFSRSFFNRIVKAMTQIITESSEPAAVASPMK